MRVFFNQIFAVSVCFFYLTIQGSASQNFEDYFAGQAGVVKLIFSYRGDNYTSIRSVSTTFCKIADEQKRSEVLKLRYPKCKGDSLQNQKEKGIGQSREPAKTKDLISLLTKVQPTKISSNCAGFDLKAWNAVISFPSLRYLTVLTTTSLPLDSLNLQIGFLDISKADVKNLMLLRKLKQLKTLIVATKKGLPHFNIDVTIIVKHLDLLDLPFPAGVHV